MNKAITDLPDALWALLRAPWHVFTVGLSNSEKRHSLLALFAPFLLLSVRSRLIILAVPLLAERFLSSTSAMWGTHFHYSLAIAPVLAMGAAAGLCGLTARLPERRRPAIVIGVATAMLVTGVAVTRINSPDSPLAELTTSSFSRPLSDAAAADRELHHVPAGASVATTDNLLAHTSERSRSCRSAISTSAPLITCSPTSSTRRAAASEATAPTSSSTKTWPS